MPIGDRPSARFRRVSQEDPPANQATTPAAAATMAARGSRARPLSTTEPKSNPVPSSNKQEENQDANPASDVSEVSDSENASAKQLVGDIVERLGRQQPRVARHPASSRFALQHQQNKHHPQPTPPTTGFPTLNVPLGTFARSRKPRSPITIVSSSTAKVQSAPSAASSTSSGREAGDAPSSASLQALREASAKDADALLLQMSRSEIRESVQELRAALSPEALDFLRRRGRQQQTGATSAPPAPLATQLRSHLPAEPSSDSQVRESVQLASNRERNSRTHEEREREEKERLAQVLSSIRTFEDLDAAYAAEIGSHPINREKELPLSGPTQDIAVVKGDFELACSLLRSSARRQTLWAAKVVAARLREDLQSGRDCSLSEASPGRSEAARPWPYPLLLPVSLRCLLDTPASSKGYILHTYVLQSLYYLLLLRACKDHIVDLSKQDTTSSVYQLFFMDDAVPTPRLDACYSGGASVTSIDPLADRCSAPVSVYGTTSKSAASDAASFAADPLWTLLSNMRILPRLAYLLHSSISSSLLPQEGVVAIVGILAMLCQRSPGAATAIAQHKTLLHDTVLRSTLVVTDSSPDCGVDTALGVPALVFLCTLARQSREAAQAMDVEAFLYRILAPAPDRSSSTPLVRLQQWALVLWRTLLRYGFAVDLTPSVLTMTVSHCTLGPHADSLAPEVFTALAQVAHCLRVVRRTHGLEGPNDQILSELRDILTQAESWVSSTVSHALRHVSLQINECNAVFALDQLRFYGSCLLVLGNAISLQKSDDADTASNYRCACLSDADMESCVHYLIRLVESECFRKAIEVCWNDSEPSLDDLMHHAASAFFSESLIMLVYKLETISSSAASDLPGLKLLIEKCGKILLERISNVTRESRMLSMHGLGESSPYLGWRNRVLLAVCRFLSLAKLPLSSEATRALMFLTIGRLQFGEESRAAVLWSVDSAFNPGHSEAESDSPTSSMLLRELCRTPEARCQLDHSFKLFGGPGITDKGFGPFDLQSLRSEANQQAPGARASDFLLPVGPLWLYQVLSGISFTDEANEREQPGKVMEILSSCLRLILTMETSENEFVCAYTCNLEAGGKLYHLTNVCLQPESVFSDSDIQQSLEALMDKFASSQDDWADSFLATSVAHSTTKAGITTDNGSCQSTAEEEKVKQLLMGRDGPINGNHPLANLSVLEDFVGDLCEAYIEYGAQYRSFTKCIRLFLLPNFPPKIRCAVLLKLRGVVHMLTLEDDALEILLPRYLQRRKDASKDAPEIIDAICSVYSKSSGSRLDSGFVVSLSVAILARSLSYSLTADRNLAPYKRRLSQLDESFCALVLQVTRSILSSDGTLCSLVRATLTRNLEGGSFLLPSTPSQPLELDDILESLQTFKSAASVVTTKCDGFGG